LVTGVQTCALPISRDAHTSRRATAAAIRRWSVPSDSRKPNRRKAFHHSCCRRENRFGQERRSVARFLSQWELPQRLCLTRECEHQGTISPPLSPTPRCPCQRQENF